MSENKIVEFEIEDLKHEPHDWYDDHSCTVNMQHTRRVCKKCGRVELRFEPEWAWLYMGRTRTLTKYPDRLPKEEEETEE